MSTTNAQDRETCWKVRNFYLNCLSASFTADQLYDALKANKSVGDSEVIIPKELKSEECTNLRQQMYQSCPQSWAEHFEKKFRGDKLKEYQMKKLKELGAQPL